MPRWGPIDEHTIVELTLEGRAMFGKFLDVLSECLGSKVSAPDLTDVLNAMREREGIAFVLTDAWHRAVLLARLAAFKRVPLP